MDCIYYHYCFLGVPSLEERKHSISSTSRSATEEGPLWLIKCKPPFSSHHLHQYFPIRKLQTAASKCSSSSSIFLSVITSPATSGDYSVLLPISAALFFVYWIANFVVPDIIYRGFQSESEDQTPEEVNSMEGEKPRPNQVNSSKHTKPRVKKKSSKST